MERPEGCDRVAGARSRFILGTAAFVLGSIPAWAGEPASAGRVADEIIVRMENATAEDLGLLEQIAGATGHQRLFQDDIWLLRLPPGAGVATLASELCRYPWITYAVSNAVVNVTTRPDDPLFPKQWSLDQASDADVDAVEAWEIDRDAAEIIVAVIDSGTKVDHEDLAANIWTNASEVPSNGIDDDGNGYVDDVHGYDFVDNDGDPQDDLDHGTLTAGILGAVGNNGIGVAGICWRVKIMPLKFIKGDNTGKLSNAVRAVEYAMQNGAQVMSNSWGAYWSRAEMQPLYEAIDAAGDAGLLFVAGAGNEHDDNDVHPFYPASLDLPEIIAVAASDKLDHLANYSNFGRTSVDVVAPGSIIWTTDSTGGYSPGYGTSMACPFVAGAVALLKSAEPQLTMLEIKDRILSSVDVRSTFEGKVASNGRLNLRNALRGYACGVRHDEFGDGLAGSGGFVPSLKGSDGNCAGDHALRIDGGIGGAQGQLWVGTSTTDYAFFGGHFYVGLATPWIQVAITLGGASGAPGVGSLEIGGPDLSAYFGTVLYLQACLLDPGAVHGISLSNALKLTIGD